MSNRNSDENLTEVKKYCLDMMATYYDMKERSKLYEIAIQAYKSVVNKIKDIEFDQKIKSGIVAETRLGELRNGALESQSNEKNIS